MLVSSFLAPLLSPFCCSPPNAVRLNTLHLLALNMSPCPAPFSDNIHFCCTHAARHSFRLAVQPDRPINLPQWLQQHRVTNLLCRAGSGGRLLTRLLTDMKLIVVREKQWRRRIQRLPPWGISSSFGYQPTTGPSTNNVPSSTVLNVTITRDLMSVEPSRTRLLRYMRATSYHQPECSNY